MSNHKHSIRVAIAGNPNSGKTTIFNNITGGRQHVGNYPGVTVEKKEGNCSFAGENLLFLDLPGTYSLTARSLDELVARNAIINEKPDVIVNVLDASNLERHLYLAAQLIELETPLVIDLNMADVAAEMGLQFDVRKLSELLGATIVSTVGRNDKGTKDLLEAVCQIAQTRPVSTVKIPYGEVLETAVEDLVQTIRSTGEVVYPVRWLAIKLLEKDQDVLKKVMQLEKHELICEKADQLRDALSTEIDLDVAFQEARHRFAVEVYQASLLSEATEEITRSQKIDKLLTNRILGLPIFLFIMWSLFNLVFEIGAYPQDWLDGYIGALGEWITTVVPEGDLQSLLVDGVIAGVGGVLSFLPLIVILFLGISFLEDTGYMARAAFIMDRLMRSFGLHGKSFIPMLLGFGCTVPAVMGTRILDNPRDRMVTILVSPFMSCGARLPVYTLLIGAFFAPDVAGTALFSIYLLGIVLAIIFAKIFRTTVFKGSTEPFVMEMPPYHMPTLKTVFLHMWERAWLYIKKAGTFILMATIIVWALVSYPNDVEYSKDFDAAKEEVTATYQLKEQEIVKPLGIMQAEDNDKLVALVTELEDAVAASEEADTVESEEVDENVETAKTEEVNYELLFKDIAANNQELYPIAFSVFSNKMELQDELKVLDEEQQSEKISQSYAAIFGKAIEPVIAPLGFDWRVGVALVAGMTAKEVLVSTMATIYAVEADEEDNTNLKDILIADPNFTQLTAISLMVFVLIYPPCIAALAVLRRELGSWGWMLFVALYSTGLAWVCSFVIFQGGKLLGL